ncbi:unnamed protein product [Thlaspi arvense]|uniref:Tudor-knot domain-containing protein n=1 Tax=Thlaspi arvense TaxID=13288 RepID=A0AAU9RIR4_THLAR|nr:unnamed protein product [Thlaspi arvense]
MGSSANTETTNITVAPASNHKHPSTNGGDANPAHTPAAILDRTTSELESSKKRRTGLLPLEVGTRVMCQWRDGKYHPVKVIERRKNHSDGNNEYEYYVHYTECMSSPFPFQFCDLGFRDWNLKFRKKYDQKLRKMESL